MLNILCVCGNGMGTSTILKINVRRICDENNIDASVESCAFGEALAYLQNAILAQTKNLVDLEGVRETLMNTIKEHFPEELHK